MGTLVVLPTTASRKKPDSWEKGHAFEDYIITLFNSRRFRLIHWRSDKKASNGVTPLSNCYPDLEFEFKGRKGFRFAVECKWREKFIDDGVYWAERWQINRYQKFQYEYNMPVYVAIGVGGVPKNPESLYVTPLDNISMYEFVYVSKLICNS